MLRTSLLLLLSFELAVSVLAAINKSYKINVMYR